MRVQLIHPPHPTAADDKMDAPLGLLYVAASLKKAGYEDVHVTDLSGIKNKDEWKIMEADIYGISSYVCTMDLSSEIARECKRKNPEAVIVGGGANLTGLVESKDMDLIPLEYDSVVVGAGELAMIDLIEDFPKVKPFYEHSLNGNLDSYPKPDYGMVNIHDYSRTITEERAISILTSRGCTFRCNFCGIPKQNRTVRYRTPEAVANEIKDIMAKYDIRAFNFQDDTFMINKKRVYELLELIAPLGIKFKVLGRVGLDTKEDYKRLRDAGCETVAFGVESGSQEMLDRMNKGIKVEQSKQAIEWVQDIGILDRIFLVLGFPGETRKTIEETKQFIEDTNPSQCGVSTFQPYPGIPVWNDPEKFGVTRIYKDFSKYVQINGDGFSSHCNIDTLWMSREEFLEARNEFMTWFQERPRRGHLQEYEKRFEAKNDS